MATQDNNTGAGAAPAAGAPAPAADVAAQTSITEPTKEISDVLHFDPFAPPKGPVQEPTDGGESGGAPVAEGTKPAAGAKPGEEVQTPEQTAAAAAAAQKPDALASAIAANTEAVRAILSQQQPQQPAQPAKDEPQAPKFNLGIPDPIMQALASEDPKERSVAMHAVINGVANHVWQQTEAMVKGVVQEVLQSVPRMIEGHQDMARRQTDVANDFYGTYEIFKQPAFVPLMQNIGMQVAQEMVAQGQAPQWNAKMRDTIADRMFALFPMLKVQHDAAVAAKAKANGTQPAKRPQPFVTGTGARPASEPISDMEAVLKVF